MTFSQAISAGSEILAGLAGKTATFDKIDGSFLGIFDQRSARAEADAEYGFNVVVGGMFSVRKDLFTGTRPVVGHYVKIDNLQYRVDSVAVDNVHYKLTLVDASK